MKIGQLSDFTQNELQHPTFAIVDQALPLEPIFVLASLTVPNECSTTIQTVEHYVNSALVKPVLIDAMRNHFPEIENPTFAYVPKNDRQIQ